MPDSIEKRWSRLEAMPFSRGLRRLCLGLYLFAVLMCFFPAGMALSGSWHIGRLYGATPFIWVSNAFGQALFSVWVMRRVSSSQGLNERALQEFGKPYAELSSRHRFDVRVRCRREMRAGGRPPDERDAVMQRESERKAYRTLRVGLPVFLWAYWIVCLCMPGGPVRAGLIIGAVVMSAMVIPVIILPQLIRLWTEPDPVTEPQVLTMDGTV